MFQPLIVCVPDDLEIEGGNKPTITIPLTQDGERFAFLEVRTWAERPHPRSLSKYDLIIEMLDNDLDYGITAQRYTSSSRWFWRIEKAGDA